jgi:phosphohistidine phosphatase SixA
MRIGHARSWGPIALVFAAALLLPPRSASTAESADALWAALQEGGRVILMRNAPAADGGEGQAEGCDAARDLTLDGQAVARRIGEVFREQAIAVASVQTSRWCRALVTAELAFDQAEPWAALDPFFQDRARREAQTAEVGERIVGWAGPGNLVLVTHEANIEAFTGLGLAEGEMIVLHPRADGTFSVEWRFAIPVPAQPS